jgi:LPS export ABC transporter protein LptC/lipopolysaccharide transport protein LptA
MATTTEIERHLGRAGGARRMAVVTVDRSRDFVRSRRHTWLVAILRRMLPLASVGVVLLYGAMMLETAGLGDALSQLSVPRILPEHLTMNNPRYEGFNSDGGSYVVTARTARQDLDKEGLVHLETIDGDLLDARKTKTNLKATRGTYDNKRARLELLDGITVVSEDGSKATLQAATVLPKENLVISKLPVLVEMPTGTVRGKSMTLRQKVKQVTFERDVVAHLKPPPKAKDGAGDASAWTATTERPGASQPAGPAPLFGAEDKPIDVTSARLDIDDLAKTAIFTGEVKAVQGESTLTTPELTVLYEADSADAKPAQPAAGLVSGQAANKLSRILAKEPVTMRQNGNEATGQALDYDARTEIATLAGNVIIVSAPDRQAASDRAEFNAKADTALLTGNVVVIQGKNELRGRRLHVDRKAGLTQLSSPAESKAGAGRITARFVQGEAADGAGKGKPSAKAKPEPAAGIASGAVAAFKTSPGAPIDIEATTLDVDDTSKVAVFRGDVHAVQGDFVVRTVELHAHYTGKSALADPAAGAPGEEASKLTRIQAKRKVVVTSKVGQTATGDYADFDTTANTVTLGGDVVLTQGQNVVRGTRLSIDMATGHTRILTEPASGPQTSSAPAADAAPPAGFPAGAGAFRSGRPSAVFYPKQVREQSPAKTGATKSEAATSDPAAASSWQSTTGATTTGAARN